MWWHVTTRQFGRQVDLMWTKFFHELPEITNRFCNNTNHFNLAYRAALMCLPQLVHSNIVVWWRRLSPVAKLGPATSLSAPAPGCFACRWYLRFKYLLQYFNLASQIVQTTLVWESFVKKKNFPWSSLCGCLIVHPNQQSFDQSN